MIRMRGALVVTFSLLVAGLPVACGGASTPAPSEEPNVEGGRDGAGGETGQDAFIEVGLEASVEGGDATIEDSRAMGGGLDAPGEVGADALADAGADVAGDAAGNVAPSDGAIDMSADARTGDAAAEAGLDTEAGLPGGTLNWAERFGITGDTAVTCLALDPTSGDIVIGGTIAGSANFGGGIATGGDAGGAAFLARFNAAGAYRWAHVFVGEGGGPYAGVEPVGVAVDGSGNVLLGGQLGGSTDFGGGVVTGTGIEDIFMAKFSSTGSYVWSKHFGVDSAFVFFRRAAFDQSGNLYTVAEPDGYAIDVGCGGMSKGSEFVAEFDTNGSCVWSQAYGSQTGTTYTTSENLALDASGNVFVTGGFYGTIDFGTGSTSAPSPGMDVYIQKFNGAGTVLWAKTFGVGASVAEVSGIGTDGSGDILLDGTFSQSLNFGCRTLTESGQTGAGDIFTAKLDSRGTCIWSNSYGDSDAQGGGPLAVDSLGGLAITGEFSGVLDLGGATLNGASPGHSAMYLAKFSSTGLYEWAYSGGPPASSASNSGGFGIGASSSSIVTTGEFGGGSLNLAGDSLAPMGDGATFLASLRR